MGVPRLSPPPPPPPPPPTPWGVQRVEEVWTTFGPNLAPKAPETFFWHTLGAKNWLHPLCVCSKCSELYGEFKYACKTGKFFSLLTPPPKVWVWAIFFLQKPHICVFKMISATRGSL